jgi:phage terminase small subunit
MTNNDTPEPPTGLGERGSAYWRTVLEDFTLDAPDLAILEQACRLVDRAAALDAVVDAEGVMSRSAQGPRVHPALVEARQTRLALVKVVKSLGLPAEED